MLTLTPTQQQQDIVDYFCDKSNDFLSVQAGAGASKTTTLLFVAQKMNSMGYRGAYLAFNKLIVAEAKTKFSGSVIVKTVHATAYGYMKPEFKNKLKREDRMYKNQISGYLSVEPITIAIKSGEDLTYDKINKTEIVDLADKTVENFCNSAETEISAKHIPLIKKFGKVSKEKYDTIFEQSQEYLVKIARALWTDVNNPLGKTPFKHHHYLKQWELDSPLIDAHYLMVDEAQDLNPVMLSIIEKNAAMGRKIILVGDTQQSIYSFTGAVDALAYVESKGVEVKQLTKSFRFGVNLAKIANLFQEDLNSNLRLIGGNPNEGNSGFQCGNDYSLVDAILTRTNAGALKAFMECIADGLNPYLNINVKEVVEIIDGIQDLRYKGKSKHYELMVYNNYEELKLDIKKETVDYQVAMIHEAINEYGAESIKTRLSNMTKGSSPQILTAHKSKGCEYDSVLLYGDFRLSDKMISKVKRKSDLDEYLRLCYVAATRAKANLDWLALYDYRQRINSVRVRES